MVIVFWRESGHFALKKREKAWLRRQLLSDAEGRHTLQEIREILTLQEGRCIYCNVQFSGEIPPTKDHLLALVDGGAHWALNIVLSCRSCNSRRSDIPFRTYCTLLSQQQNLRIARFLKRRLLALDPLNFPKDALRSFENALRRHQADHWRYLDIQRGSVSARRNAAQNRLLPSTITQIRNLS